MEMHQVQYFLATARLLNFTRAAEECNVAQPSLTRAVKQLEQEFGHELFRRERNLSQGVGLKSLRVCSWLAACKRRVIGTTPEGKCMVVDMLYQAKLFGPASVEECRVFIHRAAALDVLRMLGTERVAGAAMVAGGNLPVTLNG